MQKSYTATSIEISMFINIFNISYSIPMGRGYPLFKKNTYMRTKGKTENE